MDERIPQYPMPFLEIPQREQLSGSKGVLFFFDPRVVSKIEYRPFPPLFLQMRADNDMRGILLFLVEQLPLNHRE